MKTRKTKKMNEQKSNSPYFKYFLYIIAALILLGVIVSSGLNFYKYYGEKKIEAAQTDGKKYFTEGNYTKAIEVVREGLKYDPENIDLLLFLGRIFEVAGRTDEAKKEYVKVLEIEAENEEALFRLALIYNSEGNVTQSISLFQQAINTNPDFFTARLSLAKLYYELDELDKSEKEYLYIIEKEPYGFDMFNVYFGLGEVYFQKGEKDKAKKYWEKALKLREDDENLKEFLEHMF